MEPPFASPRPIATRVHTEMPTEFRWRVVTDWSRANKRGLPVDCFLESPCFDAAGTQHVTEIPHGRVFRISPEGRWTLLAEYDGEPNGRALYPDGARLYVADDKRGILSLDLATGRAGARAAQQRTLQGPERPRLRAQRRPLLHRPGADRAARPDGAGVPAAPRRPAELPAGNGPSPNGLALSPDEEVLFVAMTRDNAVWRLPLLPDGGTARVGRFASFHGTSGPDGLAVDAAGNLLVAHASLGSVFVLSPQGEPIARIRSCRGATTTNVALGGPGAGRCS